MKLFNRAKKYKITVTIDTRQGEKTLHNYTFTPTNKKNRVLMAVNGHTIRVDINEV